MKYPDAPSRDRYDVAVIGSGIGGLTAGSLLARAGLSVVVLEAAQVPGGYAHSFQRDGRTFDPAVRWVGDPRMFEAVLDNLGVRDLWTPMPVDPFFTASFPGRWVDMPPGRQAWMEALIAEVPHEAKGLRSLVEVAATVHSEAHMLPPVLGVRQLDAAARRYSTLFTHIRMSLQEGMDLHLQDGRAQALFSAAWPYVGNPPSRLSFMSYCQFLFSHVNRVVYSKGGFGSLVDAFVAGLRKHGGELVCRRAVERILVENGRAVGVRVDGGHELGARVVISNADATATFRDLLGPEYLPGPFLRKLERLEVGPSAFNLYLATTADLPAVGASATHEIFHYTTWDLDEAWRANTSGRAAAMFVTVPTYVDPELALPGEHLVIATVPVPYQMGDSWAVVRPRLTEELLAQFEQLWPGLRDGLTYVESATPETFKAFGRGTGGSMLGWSMTPKQTTTGRPTQATPLPGLYLTGHWTYPGGSLLRVLVSGLQTRGIVLRDLGMHAAAAAFTPPELPPS